MMVYFIFIHSKLLPLIIFSLSANRFEMIRGHHLKDERDCYIYLMLVMWSAISLLGWYSGKALDNRAGGRGVAPRSS